MKSKSLKKIIKALIYASLCCFLVQLAIIIVFKYVPVPFTPLMALRSFEHRKDTDYRTKKVWKPLHEISTEMAMAAMAAEDFRFITHKGFDWEAIGRAWSDYKKGISKRGASTISQQTAKNLFLLPHRTWLRKGIEAIFTVGIEWIWGKERILEVYLNVVETGRGLFGVEAASQYYYQKPAMQLTTREAALVASCFPNPLQRNPLFPTQSMESRVTTIEWIMSWLPVPEWLQHHKSGETLEYPSAQKDTLSQGIFTSSWVVYGYDDYDYVVINLSQKVVYRSFQEVNPNRIVVDLYGATNDTRWIAQYPTKEIANAYCRQISDDVVRIYIDLQSKHHWGYGIDYENDRLVMRIKHPPKPKLKGLRIALDAGHGGEVNGAIGVTGLKEKDVNLELVMRLKKRLEKRGAEVILTRRGDLDVSMDERLEYLHRQMPDILISIHNNASGNPIVQGTSTYYRHTGFRPLSMAIQKRLLELGVQNAGNIGNFDFALNAPTEYPNVLIEGLFLSNREDEAKLLNRRFKKKFVKKVVEGIEDFMKSASRDKRNR